MNNQAREMWNEVKIVNNKFENEWVFVCLLRHKWIMINGEYVI